MFFMSKLKHLYQFKLFENATAFNVQFQPLYDRLSAQSISPKMINSIKGRLYGQRQAMTSLNLEDAFMNAQSLDDVIQLFSQLADAQRSAKAQSPRSPQLTGKEAIKNKFDRKYHQLFDTIHNSADITELEELIQMMNKFRSAVDSQGRTEELQSAKNAEQAMDILKRVELVSRANAWSDIIVNKHDLRTQVKNRLEDFADLLIDYDNYESYKNVFLTRTFSFKTADMFFDGFAQHISGERDGMNTAIEKINAQEGIEVEKVLDNQILAWVYTFDAAEAIGSTSWCIQYSESQFNSYVYNEMRKQYYVWDFDYEPTDIKSYIGITLNEDGTIRNAHLKNDAADSNHVKAASWYNELEPLSQHQLVKWLKYIRQSGKDYPNWKTAALIHAELGDVQEFKAVLDSNTKRVVEENEFSKKLIKLLIEKNNFEMVKLLIDIDPTIAVIHFGMALQLSYDLGYADIFNYLKRNIRQSTLTAAKKLAGKNANFKNFLDLYSKSL